MYSQSFSPQNLYSCTTQTERRNSGLSKEELVQEVGLCINDSINKGTFQYKIRTLGDLYLNDQQKGSMEYLCQDLILRKLYNNIKRIYGVEQANRNQIVKQMVSLLNEKSPKWVVRLDVRHFFESINRNLLMERFQEDGRLNYQSICLLKNLFAHPVINPEKGLPRGLSVSFVMSELYMKYFDLVAENIVALFNRRENSAAVELSTPKRLKYYEQVLHYCVMGNLQAVLDEYCHMIDEGNNADYLVDKLNATFISATSYQIETTDSYCKENGRPMPMRRSFAFDYAKVVQDKNIKHNGTLQQAFNSPFRPFVLTTTSAGQEGLDFHWYTRKIVHWNLPSNPVDMEQREGRINRYKCLAIRRNIAKFFGNEYSWKDMFSQAGKQWRELSPLDYSEIVPYWCLPKEIIREYSDELEYIERLVPLYPMSIDEIRYKHLLDVLSLYRLTMGQPRQEELMQLLEGKVSKEQIGELLFDLSPYNKRKKHK